MFKFKMQHIGGKIFPGLTTFFKKGIKQINRHFHQWNILLVSFNHIKTHSVVSLERVHSSKWFMNTPASCCLIPIIEIGPKFT